MYSFRNIILTSWPVAAVISDLKEQHLKHTKIRQMYIFKSIAKKTISFFCIPYEGES